MKLLFADTETTGLSPKTQDVIQIGAVIMENKTIIEEINVKCQPIHWDTINSYALKVNNHTIEQLHTLDDPKETWKKFYDFVVKNFKDEKYTFGGQNTKFDWKFLKSFWETNKTQEAPDFDIFFETDHLDLMDISKSFKKYGLLDVPNVRLETIIEALDIKVIGDLHDALTDIKATINSIFKLLIKVKKMKYNEEHPTVVKQFGDWLKILN
jgi:DNA polymerase-3 subunit epsilon